MSIDWSKPVQTRDGRKAMLREMREERSAA